MLVTAGVPIAGQSEPEPAVTYEVCPSQAHLQAWPRPSHPSHPGVSEQHKSCALEESWRGSKEGGSWASRQLRAGKPALPSLPWCAQPQPGYSRIWAPAHFQPACHGRLPQAAVSTFPLWCLLFSYLGSRNP